MSREPPSRHGWDVTFPEWDPMDPCEELINRQLTWTSPGLSSHPPTLGFPETDGEPRQENQAKQIQVSREKFLPNQDTVKDGCPSTDEWVNNTVYPCNGILFGHKKQWSTNTYYHRDGLWKHYSEWKKSIIKGQNSMMPFTWNVSTAQIRTDTESRPVVA